MPFGRILVVDDDPLGVKVFKMGLEKHGFVVETANRVSEAINKLQGHTIKKYDAVISDYQMPGATGLELLDWIKGADDALAVIMVTSQRERIIIQSALRNGAYDFLEKPVSIETLVDSVTKACEQTQIDRHSQKTNKNIQAVAAMNQFFKSLLIPELNPYLRIHYTPNDMVGGDFVNALPCGEDQVLLMVGDVSGHDLRAGFVSSYFQGLVRGLTHNKESISDIANSFNKILLQEWTSRRESLNPFKLEPRTTLALLAVHIDLATNQATILNCGAPALKAVHNDGSFTKHESLNPPLGWSLDEKVQTESLDMTDISFIFMGTDGVHDWADDLGVNSLGLAYNLLEQGTKPKGTPPDDLLVLRYQHNRKIENNDYWHPLVCFQPEDLKHADDLPTYLSETFGRTMHIMTREADFTPIKEIVLNQEEELERGCLCLNPLTQRFKLILKAKSGNKTNYPVDL